MTSVGDPTCLEAASKFLATLDTTGLSQADVNTLRQTLELYGQGFDDLAKTSAQCDTKSWHRPVSTLLQKSYADGRKSRLLSRIHTFTRRPDSGSLSGPTSAPPGDATGTKTEPGTGTGTVTVVQIPKECLSRFKQEEMSKTLSELVKSVNTVNSRSVHSKALRRKQLVQRPTDFASLFASEIVQAEKTASQQESKGFGKTHEDILSAYKKKIGDRDLNDLCEEQQRTAAMYWHDPPPESLQPYDGASVLEAVQLDSHTITVPSTVAALDYLKTRLSNARTDTPDRVLHPTTYNPGYLPSKMGDVASLLVNALRHPPSGSTPTAEQLAQTDVSSVVLHPATGEQAQGRDHLSAAFDNFDVATTGTVVFELVDTHEDDKSKSGDDLIPRGSDDESLGIVDSVRHTEKDITDPHLLRMAEAEGYVRPGK